MNNIMLLTDSYKQSHYKQYPKGTERVYSYFESRGGQFNDVMFFGLRYFIKKYLEGQVVTQQKIEQAEKIVNAHMGPGTFNREGWEYILNKHNGRLPVCIKAVPEGTVMPYRNAMMVVYNTDPACYWLTNFLETLLVQVWYPCTVATQSREMKKALKEYWEKSSDAPVESLDFKLHDFGFRGVSSVETAGIGGAAHLVNFLGTDTMAALETVMDYYETADMPGFSIPASEHSTITSWGKEGELDAMRNMLEQYPSGLVACVSDSFDIFRACKDYWGDALKDKILERDGTLVVRPDSGNPPDMVVGVLNTLGKAFGYTTNSKGYKVLPEQVRVIQGDGIDFAMLNSILFKMELNEWAIDNVAFGSGGGLLQKLNRDTCKFAFKCCSVTVNGEQRDVYKDPVTDPGKVSKKGEIVTVKHNLSHSYIYQTKKIEEVRQQDEVIMGTVFLNGSRFFGDSWNEIKERAKV